MTTVAAVSDNHERRQDPRYLSDDNFQIKILFSSDDPRSLGKTFNCSMIDVSKGGVKILSALPLAEKSVLDLSISIKDSTKEFLVTGDVKWCKPTLGSAFSVGIQLKNRAGTPTDLDDWKNLIKNLK